MQRYSLYIDHQLVSTLIRQLEAIVQTCYQQLDQEYESHQLRTHIYEEFVFHVTALYNLKYAVKHENHEVKDQDLKKYYELTAKLEGIGVGNKFETVPGIQRIAKKGRPNKNLEAESHLIEWVKQKISTEGKLNYTKKQLDQVYFPLLGKNKPKSFPTTNYFRMLKKHQLIDISIINRNGLQRSVKEFFDKNNLSQSFCKKEQDSDHFFLVNQFGLNESDLNSTSELQEQLEEQYDDSKDSKQFKIRSAKLKNSSSFGWKSRTRSFKETNSSFKGTNSKKDKKAQKITEKSIKMKNFFNEDSDTQKIDHRWDQMSVSDDIFEKVEPQPQIYDNSKSYE